MEVTKKLDPGAHGTKRFVARFGKQWACVRYRLDRSCQLHTSGNSNPNVSVSGTMYPDMESAFNNDVRSQQGLWLTKTH
ncbi:MAG: hypothetical protein GXP09_08735 [Gammaproteobacteria bacterium]|nr:hypothetical protein [Gammaproteobacteria bacterium]